jgi:hypothetical protein
MVVLSAAICNKNAKIIFARQFAPISRLELEEHIVHFSRNIDTCTDSTHLETNKHRYIFIPIDSTLYLVILTTLSSNVIEDIEILKTIYRLLQDICGTVTSSSIGSNAYDLAIGLDDIITAGYREGITIPQVKLLIAMESQEEKEYKKQQQEKELQATKQRDEKMKELDKQKRENKYLSDAISR